MAKQSDLKEVLAVFTSATKAPENYLGTQTSVAEKLRKATKLLYDFVKSTEAVTTKSDALPELIIEQFDDEQVWQEIELQNDPVVQGMLPSVSKVVANHQLTFSQSSRKDQVARKHLREQRRESQGAGSGAHSDGESAISESDSVENILREQSGTIIDSDDDSELSEDEAELKRILDKVTAADNDEDAKDHEAESSDEDEEEEDNLDFDFDTTSKSQRSKNKSSGDKDRGARAKQSKKRKTVVDDKFFRLADLEQFLEQEDAKEERRMRLEKRGASRPGDKNEGSSDDDDDEEEEEEEYVDVFAPLPSEDEDEEEDERGYTYSEFFDPPDEDRPEGQPKKKKGKFTDLRTAAPEDEEEEKETRDDSGEDLDDGEELEEDDEEVEDDEESEEGEDVADVLGGARGQKSTFEQRQERLKQKISQLEQAALGEKPWQLAGEVSAASRPENSLLQEDLDFDTTVKPAPVITEETSAKLEDIIKQRIKDKAWDDVERKAKPTEEPFEYKKRVVLDQEKSKLSLGEIYEQEYLKLQEEEEEKVNPQHETISNMMESLFIKLDALSNFHFTPKPASADVKIVSNLPSVTVEEVAPSSVSDATLLAPEEIKKRQKGQLKGVTERTETDKNKERREKKKRQRERQNAKEKKQKAVDKLNPGLGNKYAKVKAMRELESQSKAGKGVKVIKDSGSSQKSGLTSSTKFFSQLQEEVTTHISSKKAAKRAKTETNAKTAVKFKL